MLVRLQGLRIRRSLFLLAVILLLRAQSAVAQRTIHVPGDAASIQGGIDAAQNGDTVLVAPGTYTENIDFKGKSITVTSGAKSSADAAATIIQGARTGSIVTFQSNESASAVLNGFTIQNAFGSSAQRISSDGIDISNASPSVSNNIIQNNIGCGIYASGEVSSPVVQGNTIQGNRGPRQGEETEFFGCAGGGVAGVVLYDVKDPKLIGNVIENNNALDPLTMAPSSAGIGIPDGGGEILIEGNTVKGGIQSLLSLTAASSTAIKLEVIQNLFYVDNEVIMVDLTGGYSPVSANQVTVVNNTFYNVNTGLFYHWRGGIEADNNLFFQGDPRYIGANDTIITPQTLLVCEGQPATTYNNDLFAYGFPQQDQPCPLTANNLASDPQFLVDEDTNVGAGNFRVSRSSPVVYAGDINAPLIPAADLDGKNRTVCGKIDIGAYQTHPIPPVTLTSSPNPSVGGTTVSFNMSVGGNCNVPTGVLTLLDGKTPIGTATLDASGNATFSTANLFVGTHFITATYPGDFNFDPSTSNTVQQVVTGVPTTTTLQVAPNPAVAFQNITLSATVSDNLGVASGTVTFSAGGQTLATVPLNAADVAIATVNTLGVGTYTVTATYNGSLNYGGSTSAPVSLVVNGATTATTLSSTPNPSTFGQPVTFTAGVTASQSTAAPTGMVKFLDGPTPLGNGTVSSTGAATFVAANLSVGNHTITAQYAGSSSDKASTSNAVIQVVAPATVTVSMTATPNPAPVGQAVTLSATVSSLIGAPTSGTVVFADQFGTIGTAPVTAGSANLTTSTLTSGTHNIVATYTANGGYGGAASAPYSEVIQSFDFSIALSPTNPTLRTGTSGTVTVNLQGVGNLPGNVALTVSQAPQYAAFSLSSPNVQFVAAGSGSSTLSIQTAQLPQHASIDSSGPGAGQRIITLMAGLSLPLVLFTRRRRSWRAFRLLTFALWTVLAVGSLSGCTNIYYPLNRTAAGVYTVAVTGVDQVTGIAHTATLTLTVTH